MARRAGYPLLLLLPFILGCFLGACHATAIKEDLDATSNSVALFNAPIINGEEVGGFRLYPKSHGSSRKSCIIRLPFKFIGAFLDYVYDSFLVGEGCTNLTEAFRMGRRAVNMGSLMMLHFLEHEGCSRLGDLLEMVMEGLKFACYLFF